MSRPVRPPRCQLCCCTRGLSLGVRSTGCCRCCRALSVPWRWTSAVTAALISPRRDTPLWISPPMSRRSKDAVGVSCAVLVGSSSGGYVAQQVAINSPHRVAGLVLAGSPRSLQGRPSFADEVDQLTDPVEAAWVRKFLTWFPLFHQVPQWYIDSRVDDGVRVPAHVWREALAGLVTA